MNPFDYVKAVSQTKETFESYDDYVPFLTNRALSYHADSVFQANMMNRYPNLPNKAQFEFFINTLKPRNRFSKWPKKDKRLLIVSNAYKCSFARAKEYLSLMSDEQFAELEAKMDLGGVITQEE